MMSPKIAVLFGVSSGIVVGLLEAAVGLGLTGNPLLDGLIGGGGITFAAAMVYKVKVDRLEKEVASKAGKDEVREGFDRVHVQLNQILNHLMRHD